MRYVWFVVLPALLLGVIGCGDGFPDEEMHFGSEDKVRPYAVIVEPPEAAPGETVQVTLLMRAPDPDEVDIRWQVALDYDIGLYETDEVEDNVRALPSPLPDWDADGFVTQTFSWTVPDSTLLYTSALPELVDDPTLVMLAEQVPGLSPPLTRSRIDAWLKALSPEGLAALEPLQQQAALALADRFACQVRFRATLQTEATVDVTRNLTIRHTGRLGGSNTNRNAQIIDFAVVALDKVDADTDDLDDAGIARETYVFIDEAGVRQADRVTVPRHADWTYYLVVDFERETYTSPFEPSLVLSEQGSFRWYYLRQDDPTSAHRLFLTEDGDDAEMFDLDHRARIDPAGVGSTFRIVAAVRDERSEWTSYQAAPGASVAEGIVEFAAP